MRAGTAAAAGGLALVLLALHLLPDPSRPAAVLQPALRPSAAASLALVVPGLFREGGQPGEQLLGAVLPPHGDNLARAAWMPADAAGGDRERFAYVGVLPLLLAVVACGSARGRAVAVLRGLLAAALLAGAFLPATAGAPWAGLLLVAALGGLAATGLAQIASPPAAQRSVAADLVLGSLAVALTAVLAGLALHAGASADRPLLDGLLARAGARDWSPAVLALNAEWLRTVLDRAALAAFVSMTALLLHLKARRGLTLALVLVACLLDVLSALRV